MTQIIRERIEQIRRGEVPTGYKKTEIGILPCDWGAALLGDLLDFKNGVNAEKEKYNSGVKMISVMDILSEFPIYYDSIRGQVDIDQKSLDMYGVTYGDLLFQRSSETFEDAGKSNVYLDRNKTATYSGFVIRGKKKADYEPYYLKEALRISSSRNQIVRNSAGSQHINVGQDSLSKVIVPFAPSIEQSKIAEILMKWDEAIELYQKQIDQLKRYKSICLKKMFPQKGKTDPEWRFQGFTGDWKQHCLNELVLYTSSNLTANDVAGCGLYDLYDANGLMGKTIATPINSEYISIIKDGAGAGRIRKLPKSSTFLGTMGALQAKENTTIDFVFALLSGCNLSKEFSGSTIPHIYFKDYGKKKFFVPHLKEQKAIGEFFFNLDNCILLHQQKVGIITKQRKALQQYLLNGIVRV